MNQLHEKSINLREIWQVIAKRKWLLILPFILIVGISYGGSYLISPKYQSSVVIRMSSSKIITGDIARIIPGQYERGYVTERQFRRKLNEMRSEVTSDLNLAKLITQLGLDQDEEILKKAAEKQKSFPNFKLQDLAYRILIEDLRSRIGVNFISENILQIGAESEDPLKARDIAQTLAEVYRDERLKSDLLDVRSRLEFANTQAQIYKKELEEKEEELAEFKKNYQKSAIDRGLTTQENLRDIESELDRVRRTDLVEVNDRLNFIEDQLAKFALKPEDIKTSDQLEVLKRLLLDRTSQLANLMERYTWQDPKVQSQKRDVDNTLDSIESVADNYVTDEYSAQSTEAQELIEDYIVAKATLDYLRHKEIQLASSKEGIKNSFSTGPDAAIQLEKMEKEVARAKMLYDQFLESYTGSQLAMEVYREEAENRYKIIEPAFVPLKPYWPNRLKITLMGCALGLLLGTGAVILAEVTDNSVKKIENIENQLGLKVLGTIPKIEFKSAQSPKKTAITKSKESKMVGSKS
ncbi:MAG: hypothetical protein GF404_10415 [candidate division Zixibacteria bacterium]|nr:hypothetical protein [candidate division Zixibacteria bacterium]